MERSPQPQCSTVLLRPLAKYLRTHGELPSPLRNEVESALRLDRIPTTRAVELFERTAHVAGPNLGLQVAFMTELGDFEVLEWVATSASTWREANQIACRYIRILNDAADFRQVVCEDKSHLMLGSTLPIPRELVDFQLAAYHLAIRLRIPEVPPELEVWFKMAEPDYAGEYRVVFEGAKLVFEAAFNGFVTDAWRLDTRLPTANEPLHRVLRAHADHLLAELGNGDNLIQRVSADILNALSEGAVAAEQTATRLGMARRTLTRRLAQEGTSYSELLKEARYRTAIHYLQHTRHSVEDIAFLLGFSECAAFARAFKRWSGQAPADYRRAHPGQRSA